MNAYRTQAARDKMSNNKESFKIKNIFFDVYGLKNSWLFSSFILGTVAIICAAMSIIVFFANKAEAFQNAQNCSFFSNETLDKVPARCVKEFGVSIIVIPIH